MPAGGSEKAPEFQALACGNLVTWESLGKVLPAQLASRDGRHRWLSTASPKRQGLFPPLRSRTQKMSIVSDYPDSLYFGQASGA